MNERSTLSDEQTGHGPTASRDEPAREACALDRGRLSVPAVLASLVLAACGGGDSLPEAAEDPGAASASATPSASTGPTASPASDMDVVSSSPSTTESPTDTSAESVAGPSGGTEGVVPPSAPSLSPPNAPEAPDGAGAGDGPVRLRPKCVTQDSQVLLVGDSYINWISHSFPADLAELSGQNWRLEAIGGTSLASGGIAFLGVGFIPDQFERAIAADPNAHTIVMDGGGNDVLIRDVALAPNSCTRSGSSDAPGCQQIVDLAVDAARDLIARAAAQGIRDVIYFFYPHVPAFTFLTEDDPNEILDYALPKARDVCERAEEATGGTLRCRFVDMVPVFAGHPEYFNEDIHPNQVGGRVMAETIWQIMEDNCLGQKGAKDCCEP
jgi:hypothetical protein